MLVSRHRGFVFAEPDSDREDAVVEEEGDDQKLYRVIFEDALETERRVLVEAVNPADPIGRVGVIRYALHHEEIDGNDLEEGEKGDDIVKGVADQLVRAEVVDVDDVAVVDDVGVLEEVVGVADVDQLEKKEGHEVLPAKEAVLLGALALLDLELELGLSDEDLRDHQHRREDRVDRQEDVRLAQPAVDGAEEGVVDLLRVQHVEGREDVVERQEVEDQTDVVQLHQLDVVLLGAVGVLERGEDLLELPGVDPTRFLHQVSRFHLLKRFLFQPFRTAISSAKFGFF